MSKHLFLITFIIASNICFGQANQNLQAVSIENNNSFEGYDLLDISNEKLFVLAEQWHNIRSVPKATLKLLRHLHTEANVRILAIEQGASAAHQINKYLQSGDTTVLRQIARNTMFWGQENWRFFEDLRAFNMELPSDERVFVRSIDIEYKMESAILWMNELIGEKEIPVSLHQTVGRFNQLFDQSEDHRTKFEGLAVMYYYDKELVTDLVNYTLADLKLRESTYVDFFASDFQIFKTLIEEMQAGLLFDYTNPNTNYKFRDRIIYWNIVELVNQNPEKGILCVIGAKHASKRSSIHTLQNAAESPLYKQVMNIRVSALYKKSLMSGDLRRINFTFPDNLRKNEATLIKHDPENQALRSKKEFHYTLFINELGSLTPFPNVFSENY